MDCPVCQTSNSTGQKFCGSCGHKLEASCAQCGASNPPHYKFCGQCGFSLDIAGAISLARSGLISRVNQKALDLFGYRKNEMQGKPFSLFVDREDLVIFFSHWNELLNDSEKQSFEIRLKHKKEKSIYALLACSLDERPNETINEIQIFLSEVTDKRLASSRMQSQQDLLNLIFAVTDNISTVSKKHLHQSIEDALKKICLFAKADRCFIYGINRRLKRLEPAYQWCQPASLPLNDSVRFKAVSLAKIKRTIVRMRQEQAYVFHNVAKLTPLEREELLAWHQAEVGAVICHLIYSGKRPIGVIGVTKDTSEEQWAPDCAALVKLLGQFLADKISFAPIYHEPAEGLRPPPVEPGAKKRRSKVQTPEDMGDKNSPPREQSGPKPARPADPGPEANPSALPDMTRPMVLEKISDHQVPDQEPVFPRDDGLVLLTCPRCGTQESVSVGQFDTLGNAISVHCPCGKRFTAVLEKRRYFRKPVLLEGYFSLNGDLGPAGAKGAIWGPMIVKDLSKAGLRFCSKKADLVHPGDLLMVRFNLDNSNKALIHKPARVISITDNAVGCLFEGSDRYDITLGFYFI